MTPAYLAEMYTWEEFNVYLDLAPLAGVTWCDPGVQPGERLQLCAAECLKAGNVTRAAVRSIHVQRN